MMQNKKQIIRISILSFLGILILLGIFFLFGYRFHEKKQEDSKPTNDEINYEYQKNGIPKFITGNFTDKKVYSSDDALEVFNDLKSELSLKNPKEEFILDYEETANQITYYRFQQIYQGVVVDHHEMILSVDKDGKVLSLSGYYDAELDVNVSPKITIEEIEQLVKEYFKENTTILDNELKIWNHKLVYVINAYSDEMAGILIIDANTKEILKYMDPFLDADSYTYTAYGVDDLPHTIQIEEFNDLFQKKYRFHDQERNIYVADYHLMGPIFSVLFSALPGELAREFEMENGVYNAPTETLKKNMTEYVSAMANFETIYDYYKKVLNRDSYDNKGSKIIVNVGVTAQTFSKKDLYNAMWCNLTNQMYIGNWKGVSLAKNLDVLGHEFTHGVIQSVAHLTEENEIEIYGLETGALNEAYADIMGNLIEGQNWTMSEGIETLRDAAHPEKFNHPVKKFGENYDAHADIHVNASLITHSAYLMYEAGAFKNREEMAKVWYQSLFYLSPTANFEDCAFAVLEAARVLGLSQDSINKIYDAFAETNILAKKYQVQFNVKDGAQQLDQVRIDIMQDDEVIRTINVNPGTVIELEEGVYTFQFHKDQYKDCEETYLIEEDKTLEIYMSSSVSDTTQKNALGESKKVMTDHLDNFSYTATITTQTGFFDVVTTMDCKEDRKSKLGYCITSNYGMSTEEYFDYANGKSYTKMNSIYDEGKDWEVAYFEPSNTNSYLNLNDSIFDMTETKQGDKTLYVGKISNQKIAEAMSQSNADIDTSNLISDDIKISILVNSSKYIEKMNFEMEIMGIMEIMEVNFSNYNTSGNIVIPEEVKG